MPGRRHRGAGHLIPIGSNIVSPHDRAAGSREAPGNCQRRSHRRENPGWPGPGLPAHRAAKTSDCPPDPRGRILYIPRTACNSPQ
ncbi:MAG: hypothetical protein MZV64_00365 [Ignavibacteriales bacterium]|nr:hypothetical protein [Ignavibacteriales bacterium]